ncbi:Chitin synthase 4 [Elasticomyces elasticus]|uniref:Chitin synthase 4 n=1 Tax=Exophiala sideris TaxID=1016849 RepID=A0ABR0J7P0_9EURO|nr:Chitin synthase 4 [Elasticomyces elasticus]KAK5029480.1 Chitin synthase 4 [Exophiala sideris]KAK5036822.1 Chitin synthase 4 [Exophiala sideris]KAK5058110.1 Chitin synthase 4 [Exophiala sideris]KAK5182069.1 Chitin synthase 4 [Eurotiomycetes sp. CCFEE 6388]
MAETTSHPLPPTPPPNIYSPPLRSDSPQIIEPMEERGRGVTPISRPGTSPSRKMSGPTISMSPADDRPYRSSYAAVNTDFTPQDYPVSHTPDSLAPGRTLTPQSVPQQDPTRLSPAPQAMLRVRPGEGMADQRRVSSENFTSHGGIELTPFQRRNIRHVSASALEEESTSDVFEPLRYHHQLLEDAEMDSVEKRASRLTLRTDGSGHADHSRISTYGRNLQRPDSGFSSTSDFRGRTYSPSVSPSRPISRSSRSPDTRPLSYVDLLNVPYPQPPPSGAENLVNSGLRTVVGRNANLLSTRKTLEMYRANVKKTSDPAVQYEFAIFMISAAQEEGLEAEGFSDAPVSEKSHASAKDDLLKEAKHILQKLSDRSYPFAQYYLADGYASGLFNKGKEDWDRAFPLFLAASKHGHAEAGYRTALCYEFGWGTRIDAAKAVQFYQHAASKNHPGAMLRLGRACLIGDMGLTKRYREGIRWLKRAAESADFQYNQAPYDLACLHETGFGPDVFVDGTYAAQLFTKAADLGHVEANYRLGQAYEFGQLNCPNDAALSIHFYTGAAERGHALSQMALCAWYMVGVPAVLEKDESEAYEWAKKAAEQGLAKAQYTVGYFTEMGIGCRRDPLEANVWYVKAADQGEERAKHRIAAITAAGNGADPVTAAAGKKAVLRPSKSSGNIGRQEGERKKKFGIF